MFTIIFLFFRADSFCASLQADKSGRSPTVQTPGSQDTAVFSRAHAGERRSRSTCCKKKITRSTRRGLSSYICVRPAATASRPLRGSESAATRRMLPVLDFLQNSSFSFIYEPRRLYNLHQIPRTNRSHRDVNESAYFSCRKFAQNFAKTSSTRDLG